MSIHEIELNDNVEALLAEMLPAGVDPAAWMEVQIEAQITRGYTQQRARELQEGGQMDALGENVTDSVKEQVDGAGADD